MPTVRIEPNYKVTIPKDERDALGLKVGEEITITVHRPEALPTYTPTKRELAAIEKGRAEIRKGNFYTLDELRASLERNYRPPRTKTSRSRIKA